MIFELLDRKGNVQTQAVRLKTDNTGLDPLLAIDENGFGPRTDKSCLHCFIRQNPDNQMGGKIRENNGGPGLMPGIVDDKCIFYTPVGGFPQLNAEWDGSGVGPFAP